MSVAQRRLDGSIGVELDVDPSVPLTDSQVGDLRGAFNQHKLVMMRGEASFADQQRIVGTLGNLVTDDEMYISNVRSDGLAGARELEWHSDKSFTAAPLRGLSLYAVEVEDGSTCTRFADAASAYARLSPGIRRRLGGRNARFIHRSDSSDESYAVHPVFIRHPDTNEPVVFVNKEHTAQIVDASPEESNELLGEVFRVLYDPANIYEHWWRVGDLVIWDNLALQHSRPSLRASGPRTLRRVELAWQEGALQSADD